MRQDKVYWSNDLNFDFETEDYGISHYFDFADVCRDNYIFYGPFINGLEEERLKVSKPSTAA